MHAGMRTPADESQKAGFMNDGVAEGWNPAEQEQQKLTEVETMAMWPCTR